MVVIATVILFMLGGLITILFQNKRQNLHIYITSFGVACAFMLLFHHTWIALELENFRGVVGLMSQDGSGYHLEAVYIAENNLKLDFEYSPIHGGRVDYYHSYFLALIYYLFGGSPIIGKIYQVMLFSIAVALWVCIIRNLLSSESQVKHFYRLLLFCIPLLSYNALLLKEISLFFSTAVAVFGYTRYYYSHKNNNINLLLTIFGIILMFAFRRQFALVMFFALAMATLYGSGITQQKKVLYSVGAIVVFLVASTMPIFQNIGAVSPLTEGGTVYVGRGEGHRVAAQMGGETAGMVGGARLLLTNPLIALPMFVYGVFMMFFHPPFLYTPAEMIARGNLGYLTFGYYNAFFAILLPAFYFGARYLYKNQRKNPVLLALLFYFVLASLGTIFGSDSYRRFKISYFWPIAFLYISYGIATFPVWKKYLPLSGIILLALFAMYFMADLIGFVSM